MALDTQAKRASAVFFPLVGPNPGWPDGDIDQADRQDCCGLYRGNLVTVVTPTYGVVAMNVYVPVVKMSVQKPFVSMTARVPSVKISVTKDSLEWQ